MPQTASLRGGAGIPTRSYGAAGHTGGARGRMTCSELAGGEIKHGVVVWGGWALVGARHTPPWAAGVVWLDATK